MIPEGFIPNSAVEGSAALPEVWTNMADFQQKAADLQNAAQALATAAASARLRGREGHGAGRRPDAAAVATGRIGAGKKSKRAHESLR